MPIGGVASERVCACSLRSRLLLIWKLQFTAIEVGVSVVCNLSVANSTWHQQPATHALEGKTGEILQNHTSQQRELLRLQIAFPFTIIIIVMMEALRGSSGIEESCDHDPTFRTNN